LNQRLYHNCTASQRQVRLISYLNVRTLFIRIIHITQQINIYSLLSLSVSPHCSLYPKVLIAMLPPMAPIMTPAAAITGANLASLFSSGEALVIFATVPRNMSVGNT